MYDSLFISMIFNIGFLVLIANLASRVPVIKGLLTERTSTLQGNALLAVFFGLISVLSTYTGMGVNGAIVNTRVIGVLTAGLMGGPVVGMGAALIGGVHRWLFDIGGFTALACACSTLLEGVLGSLCHRWFHEKRLRGWRLAALAALAEVGQMVIILLIARPLPQAWALVKVIAAPMILMNSCGILAFVGAFHHVFVEQDGLTDKRVRLSLGIAQQCLPYLRKGLYSTDLDQVVSIIHNQAGCPGVAITDKERVLCHRVEGPLDPSCLKPLPALVTRAMDSLQTQVALQEEEDSLLSSVLRHHAVIAAPLVQNGKAVGCLVLAERKKWLPLEAEVGFVEGLATLFATQLELSGLDEQQRLLQRAEFLRLQSQVNPHFLFNALNTLSCFCREKPERARELLLILGKYFRYTTEESDYSVDIQRELEHVQNYLALEQARFEENLTVHLDVDCMLEQAVRIPSFLLQPIVENAIRHGADARGHRYVSLMARPTEDGFAIEISDHGQGFAPWVLEALTQDSLPGHKVGLINVHRRLKSMYGQEYGLRISSTPEGSTVTILLPVLCAAASRGG